MNTDLLLGGIGAVANVASNIYTTERQINEAKKQREWNEMMMDKQNDFNVDMWNKNNEYNSPENQRQRLLDAGINPLASSMGNQPASQVTSASPNSASMPQITNPMNGVMDSIIGMQQLSMQKKLNDAQVERTKAETDKLISETSGINIVNEFLPEVKQLEVEGRRLANSASEKQLIKLEEEIKDVSNHAKLLVEQAKTEESKQAANFAAAALDGIKGQEILEMLPYNKAFKAAQTENEKAEAALKWLKGIEEQQLIDNSYFINMAKVMGYQSVEELGRAVAAEIGTMRRTGKYSNNKFISTIIMGVQNFVDMCGGLDLKAFGNVSFGKESSESESSSVSKEKSSSSEERNFTY